MLEKKDASKMLEWMHDENVVRYLQGRFGDKPIADCEKFIESSWDDPINLHMAIVNDIDIYMGTVSLKHISTKNKEAEFAIALRTCAMGKGYAQYAMKQILQRGIDEFKLDRIYWCVSPQNKRAVRFYDKNNYQRMSAIDQQITGYTDEQIKEYIWYFFENRNA